MIRMGKESKLPSAEVIDKALAFFGPSRLGMKVIEQGDCCARFEGAGRYVSVQTAQLDTKEGANVNVEGRQSKYQIKQFMEDI